MSTEENIDFSARIALVVVVLLVGILFAQWVRDGIEESHECRDMAAQGYYSVSCDP
jgi:hypothetical protein